MVNKGLKDKESLYIENALKELETLIFVPKFWNVEDLSLLENSLANFGLNLENLINYSDEQLITLIERLHLNWAQMENFADILQQLTEVSPLELNKKSLALYQYIQQNNTTFSVGIMTKITSAKAKIKNNER